MSYLDYSNKPLEFVGYYRVSTKGQSNLVKNGNQQKIDSSGMETRGLGLQSQKEQVSNYVKSKNGILIEEFKEVESGTSKGKRVEIYKAIDLVRRTDSTLIVAKLDRLARDVEFTAALYRSGINFICCDNPDANKLTINILSVIAQNEAEMISRRVKDALGIKRKNIEKGIYTNKDGSMMKPIDGKYRLGGPKTFTQEMRDKACEKRKSNAENNKENIQATNFIVMNRLSGMTFQEIANKLNELQYRTRYDKEFKAATVYNLFEKYKEKNPNVRTEEFKGKMIYKIITDSKEEGKSYQKIADYLNDLGLKNKRGGPFKLCTVRNYYMANKPDEDSE
jgi:DNA invertase Pin-like site-specific DNA recombinase